MTNEEALAIIKRRCRIQNDGEVYDDVIWDAYDMAIKAMAIKALEKQIPVLVNLSGDGYADGEFVYDMAECPRCGWETDDSDAHWGDSFCPNCGQALLWEDSDES